MRDNVTFELKISYNCGRGNEIKTSCIQYSFIFNIAVFSSNFPNANL